MFISVLTTTNSEMTSLGQLISYLDQKLLQKDEYTGFAKGKTKGKL